MTHLIVDIFHISGLEADGELLVEPCKGERLLRKICDAVKMEVIGDFHSHQFEEDPAKGWQGNGYTTVGLLSTSHISIHTFPEHDGCQFDLFSCEDFSYSNVIEVLRETFGKTADYKIHLIDRDIV